MIMSRIYLYTSFLLAAIFHFDVMAGTPVGCIAEPGSMAVTYGDAVSCNLAASDVDTYLFNGASGDNILIRVTRTNGVGGKPCIDLSTPGGVPDASACGETPLSQTVAVEAILAEDGAFSFDITATSPLAAFDYIVVVERNTPASPTALARAYSDQVDNVLDYRGDPDYISFNGNAGDHAMVRATRTNSTGGTPCIKFWGPNGQLKTRMCDGNSTTFNMELAQTGQYIARIESENPWTPFDYTAHIERVWPPSPSSVALEPGTVLPATFDSAGDPDFFTFCGAAGDTVTFDVVRTNSNGGNPCLRLVDPSGHQEVALQCQDNMLHVEHTLLQSGTYVAQIEAENPISQFNYTVEMQTTGSGCSNPGNIACEIGTSQASYVSGETVTIDPWRFVNTTGNVQELELKTWLQLPGAQVVSIVNAGADCSLILPGDADISLGPIPLFPVNGTTPVGIYELGCRLLDCRTGKERSVELAPFEVQ